MADINKLDFIRFDDVFQSLLSEMNNSASKDDERWTQYSLLIDRCPQFREYIIARTKEVLDMIIAIDDNTDPRELGKRLIAFYLANFAVAVESWDQYRSINDLESMFQ